VGRDGAAVVEWTALQPWSDGNVGMFGHSGSGISQLYVAARQPPHLKAIIPGAAPVDMYRDISYPGGLFDFTFMYHWSEDAQPASESRAARIHIEAGDTGCAEFRKTRKTENVFGEMRDRPLDGEWWAQHSIYPVASRIRTPTYIVFGWQDQNVHSRAAYVFDLLSGPRKLLLAEDGHSLYIRAPEVRREKLRFFEHWLKGVDNGIMDEKPVKVWFTMKGAVERIPDKIGRFDRIPIPETRWTKFYIGPERSLFTEPPKTEIREKYLYPMGSAFVYGGDSYPHTPFGLGSLTYRSRPFTRETTLLGPIAARLFLSSTQTDTSIFVVLNEIRPDGQRKYLARGYLLASLRETDPRKSTEQRPGYLFRRSTPLRAGEATELQIELNSTGSVIRPGSFLEFQIMAPGITPEPNGQWGFMPLPMGMNTLHASPQQPSYLILPVIGEK
jgi:putative CocE/NonD family hydrolase